MRVLFLKDVPGVALGGDVKEVKNGYARNYLIPYNIAVLANDESMKQVEKIKVESEKERIALMEDLKAVFESIKDLTVNIPMLSSQTGKLYGSVGHDIISGAIKESKNIEIEDRYIKLSESIKEHGVYNIRVEISEEMSTLIKVIVHDPEQNPEDLLLSLNAEAEQESTEEAPPEAEQESTEEAPEAEQESTEEAPEAEQESAEEENKN
jgi:large subunit ribosomal protein L9